MKTDDLVTLLATGTEAVDAKAPTRRYLTAVTLGTVVATSLVAGLLGFDRRSYTTRSNRCSW